MIKLVIWVDAPDDPAEMEDVWPEFLHQAEAMPGLRREVSCRVEEHLFGACRCARLHELYFDGMEDARLAMASPAGRRAGALLQQMTGGRMSLFFAEHMEAESDSLRPPPASGQG